MGNYITYMTTYNETYYNRVLLFAINSYESNKSFSNTSIEDSISKHIQFRINELKKLYGQNDFTSMLKHISELSKLQCKNSLFSNEQLHNKFIALSAGINDNKKMLCCDDIIDLQRNIVCGIAIGDSLGSTSEFKKPWDICQLIKEKDHDGWPFRFSNTSTWKIGEATDDTDMCICIIKAFKQSSTSYELDAESVLNEFILWLKKCPKDIGNTINTVLSSASLPRVRENALVCSLNCHKINPKNESNGALMRNGVIPVLFHDKDEKKVIEASIIQSTVTHFNPKSVLLCCLHSILIHRCIGNGGIGIGVPTIGTIFAILKQFPAIISNLDNELCKYWYSNFSEDNNPHDELVRHINEIIGELEGFETMDPYTYDYKGRSGWCVISFKIALWALYWSCNPKDTIPNCIPFWLPLSLFNTVNKFNVITWIAAIGEDSDTYCAIAGPLLAVYHRRHIPKTFSSNLLVKSEIFNLFEHIDI